MDFWQLFGVVGGWSGALMALAIQLHTMRAKQVRSIGDRIDAAEEAARQDHRALARQVSDTNLTIAEHYVRKRDLSRELAEIKDQIGKGFDKVNARVDRLYEQGREGGHHGPHTGGGRP